MKKAALQTQNGFFLLEKGFYTESPIKFFEKKLEKQGWLSLTSCFEKVFFVSDSTNHWCVL
jgi:hypothetical protein